MFSAYVSNPDYCRFEGQDPSEKVLLLLRAHFITNLGWLSLAIFMFALPFLISQVLPFLSIDPALVPDMVVVSFFILDYLLALIISFEGFLSWYFNATLVTNEKIVDIDFHSLLHKSVDLAPLSKIEEADSTIQGIMGTFFNFGNVTVQTAGSKIAIEMKNVPRPAQVADLILDLAKKMHTGHGVT